MLKAKNNVVEDDILSFTVGTEFPTRYNRKISHRRSFVVGSDAECGSYRASTSVSRKPSSFGYICSCLCVLQDISSMLLACDHYCELAKEEMFFSSLYSVHDNSNWILRKLRGLFMVISLDCTKLELLEEVNRKNPTKKSKEKSGAASRRKKAKTRNTKRVAAAPESALNDLALDRASKVPCCLLRLFLEIISVRTTV